METRPHIHIFNNEENEQWIEDHLERETVVARQRVRDSETVIKHVEEDIRNTENAGLATSKPKISFPEMLHAIKDSLTDLASSNNEEDQDIEDNDEEDTVLGMLSEDDKSGWVMGTISKSVLHRLESFRQKQIILDTLT